MAIYQTLFVYVYVNSWGRSGSSSGGDGQRSVWHEVMFDSISKGLNALYESFSPRY